MSRRRARCWCGRGVASDYPDAQECEEHDVPPTTRICPTTDIPTSTCAHCRTSNQLAPITG